MQNIIPIKQDYALASGDDPIIRISPMQLRGARGMMGWTRKECALVAGLSPETIKNIECSIFKSLQPTYYSLISVFARHGIEFFNLGRMQLHTLSGHELNRIVNVEGLLWAHPVAESAL